MLGSQQFESVKVDERAYGIEANEPINCDEQYGPQNELVIPTAVNVAVDTEDQKYCGLGYCGNGFHPFIDSNSGFLKKVGKSVAFLS